MSEPKSPLKNDEALEHDRAHTQLQIGLISDTHGQLRSSVFDAFANVDLIIHAGDVGTHEILIDLATIAPVHAVCGNTDDCRELRLPQSLNLEIAGKNIFVSHGHQHRATTPEALLEATPAEIVVYGHTHIPLIQQSPTRLLINPGAAGPRRFKLEPTVAILKLSKHSPPQVHLVALKESSMRDGGY